MKLKSPFTIGARLAPCLPIGAASLSFDAGQFVIDLPDGSEYIAHDFRFPACGIAGDTPESRLQDGFAAMLSFLSACAESRAYASRTGRAGDNADLFPANVGEWAESVSDDLAMLACELETRGLIASDRDESDDLPDDSDPQDARTHSLAYREAHASANDDLPRADSAEDLT